MVVRAFDLVASFLLLFLTSPLLLAVAVLIKLDSRGPVFFLQERVGRGWRRFKMFKFRKMHQRVGTDGPGITSRFDPRITRVGSWLERTKLDELPQLINVLLGQMSLVGPRPEIPRFTGEPYRQRWDRVLAVKPGIFGPNQITHRNESELFPEDCEDVEAYYIEHILPQKLKVDADYARRKSLFHDLKILFLGVWVSLAGAVTRDTIRTRRWQIAYLVAGVLLGEITLVTAVFLRFNWSIAPGRIPHFAYGLVLMVAARLVAFLVFRVHRSIHTYFTLSDALRICASVAMGTVIGIAAQMLMNIRALSRAVFVVDGVLLAMSMIGASYLIDRVLELAKRRRTSALMSVPAYLVWSAVAGVAGIVSMLYALAFVWPGIFAGLRFGTWAAWRQLIQILALMFLVRLTLFPVLLHQIRRAHDVVAIATNHGRELASHLVLVFVADITGAFFMNIRNFSRGAVIVNALFYGLLLGLVLTVRCFWNRQRGGPRRGMEPVHSPVEKRILVVGDGRETSLLVSAIRYAEHNSMRAVGVVTSNPANRTRHVEGVEVLGTTQNLAAALQGEQPSLVLVLNNTISSSAVRATVRACRKAGVEVRFVPGIMQLVSGSNGQGGLKHKQEPAAREFEPSGIEVR